MSISDWINFSDEETLRVNPRYVLRAFKFISRGYRVPRLPIDSLLLTVPGENGIIRSFTPVYLTLICRSHR